MSNYIFLSHILNSNTPSYGNRDKLIIEQPSRIVEGESANSSKWTFSNNHLGTHVDVPNHFYNSGKTITNFKPQEWLFNKIQVIDIPCDRAKLIKKEDINCEINTDIDLLLIRTGYEKFRLIDKYWNDNPGIDPHLCFWLRSNFSNLRAIGFDFISLTSWNFKEEGKKAHQILLSPNGKYSPILIIEDMNFSDLQENIIEVILAPLFVENGNGSPVTVFAKTIK